MGREGKGREGRKERREGRASRQFAKTTPHQCIVHSKLTTIRKQLKMIGPANTINMKNPDASKYCC